MGTLGLLLLFYGVSDLTNQRSGSLGYFLGAILFLGLAVTFFFLLHSTDARNKAIRRVLGANTIGSCDPSNLPVDVLRQMAGEPRVAHGTATFADAARSYFLQRSFARAMWAARVCVALEGGAEGESLTDMILSDPAVIAAIEEVCRDAQRWAPLMFADEGQSTPADVWRPVHGLPSTGDDRVRPA